MLTFVVNMCKEILWTKVMLNLDDFVHYPKMWQVGLKKMDILVKKSNNFVH